MNQVQPQGAPAILVSQLVLGALVAEPGELSMVSCSTQYIWHRHQHSPDQAREPGSNIQETRSKIQEQESWIQEPGSRMWVLRGSLFSRWKERILVISGGSLQCYKKVGGERGSLHFQVRLLIIPKGYLWNKSPQFPNTTEGAYCTYQETDSNQRIQKTIDF